MQQDTMASLSAKIVDKVLHKMQVDELVKKIDVDDVVSGMSSRIALCCRRGRLLLIY